MCVLSIHSKLIAVITACLTLSRQSYVVQDAEYEAALEMDRQRVEAVAAVEAAAVAEAEERLAAAVRVGAEEAEQRRRLGDLRERLRETLEVRSRILGQWGCCVQYTAILLGGCGQPVHAGEEKRNEPQLKGGQAQEDAR